MSNEQVIGRLQCINPTSEDAKGSLSNRDLLIDDTPAITVGQIEMKCREFEKNSSRKLDMVIIDYLQLMYCENPKKDRSLTDLKRSEIGYDLKKLASKLNIPVIVLSQLSRMLEYREDKHPRLSDLAESSAAG